MDRIPTKIKWKICPFYIVLNEGSYTSYKNVTMKPLDLLFLVAFISFYISRYQFLQISWFSFNIRKKDFRHEFSFFNRFIQTPSPP